MAKVTIDRDNCIGCGACTSISSDIFEMANDGKAKVIVEDADEEKAKEAAESCPVNVIKVE